jgi:hypothetical protein
MPARPVRVGFATTCACQVGSFHPDLILFFHLLNQLIMKVFGISLVLLFFISMLPLFGQNPLVGTWEMKTDSTRSFKIITPTHWMVFVETMKGDSSKFAATHGGTYTLNGNKYIEHITIASWEGHEKAKTDYTVKVAGNKLYLKGPLTLSDSSVIPLDEAWQKVSSSRSYPKNPALGTWNQLSSTHIKADGKKESHTRATATCLEIITPTHWMRISHRNKKFENVFGGPYTLAGNKMSLKIGFASFPFDKEARAVLTQEVIRDKRYVHGIATRADGTKILTWDDVFQKVNGKSPLAKSTVNK